MAFVCCVGALDSDEDVLLSSVTGCSFLMLSAVTVSVKVVVLFGVGLSLLFLLESFMPTMHTIAKTHATHIDKPH